MNWEEHRKILLKNPELRRALKEHEPEFGFVKDFIKNKIEKKLTQRELAKRVGMTTSAFNVLELNLGGNPKISTLKKFARALDMKLEIRLVEKKRNNK